MSGSGKTTAARRLAERRGLAFHEMDTIALGPGWSTPPDLEERVAALAAGDDWVVDSWGPPSVRAGLWGRADTVVWLDFPRRVVLPRLLRRSLRRSWTRERIFGGNVERWQGWLVRDHPFWHAVTTFGERRRTIRRLVAGAPQATLVRLVHPRDLESWLDAQ